MSAAAGIQSAELGDLYPGANALLLIALEARGKKPLADDWNGRAMERWQRGDDRDAHLDRAAKWLAEGGNLGFALPPGVVALDADTAESAAWLAQAMPDAPMQQTARGAHFLCRVPEEVEIRATVAVEIADGITIDLRVGGRSQIVVEPSIHETGAVYCWKIPLPESIGELPLIPAMILERIATPTRPRPKAGVDGDRIPSGQRNDTLARYAGKLRRSGLSAEEINPALQEINERRCDPPLSEFEVRGIARSVARYEPEAPIRPCAEREAEEDQPRQGAAIDPPPQPDEFFGKEGFVPSLVGERLKLEAHVALGEDDRLYRYADGVFVPDGDAFAGARLRELLGEKFKRRHLDEVRAWLRAEAPSIHARGHERFLNVKNGLLDWRTGELRPHTPEHRSAIQIPVEWHPHSCCPAIEKFLVEVLPDEKTVNLVLEIIGYALLANPVLHAALLFLGPGRNGKSVLLSIIRALLGPANVAAVPLQLFSESRFAPAQLFGKLANVCGDLDARAIERTDVFKMMTGGDAIHAERKYGHPFAFVSFAIPIFSANEVPYSRDQSEAWFERWIVVPMQKVIDPGQRDPRLTEKLTTDAELEGLLVLALEAARRLMQRKRFELPESVRAAGRDYRQELDTAAGWLAECCALGDPQAVTSRATLYKSYSAWCADNGHRFPLRASAVYARLRQHPEIQENVREGERGFRGVKLT